MATPSELRRGLAFVEIGIDEAFLRAELGKAQAQVGQFAENLRSAGAAGGGGVQQFLTQGLRAVSVTRLATLGVDAISSAIRISRGDWDELHEVMKGMPLGIGAFHTALLGLREALMLTGTTAKETGERIEKGIKWQAAVQGLREFTKATQAHTAALGVGEVQAKMIQVSEDARAKQAKVLADAEEKGLLTREVKVYKQKSWWGAMWTAKGESDLWKEVG
ncbi:MAG: hypothetical protein NTU94_13090, partial [Planctomycetota bacterium]|nr:hypothetical protein [Planctomycetota bacterium]